MIIHKIVVGPFETNCYLLADGKTKETIIIDPGDEPEKILAVIKKENLKPIAIALTHTHSDHIGALEQLKNHFQIQNYGSSAPINLMGLKTIETPGHTEDGVCFADEKNGFIFSGDTLFKNSIGRTDLPGGDYVKIRDSLKRLLSYPDYFKVYPGHGPETSIGQEKRNNPFLSFLER